MKSVKYCILDIYKGISEISFGNDIKDYSLIPLVTHYSGKYYTTYKLTDYTDELAKKHKISQNCEFSVEILWNLYNKIMGN